MPHEVAHLCDERYCLWVFSALHQIAVSDSKPVCCWPFDNSQVRSDDKKEIWRFSDQHFSVHRLCWNDIYSASPWRHVGTGVFFPETAFLHAPSLHASVTFSAFHSPGAFYSLAGRRELSMLFPCNKGNPVENGQLFHYAISQYL